MAYKDCPCVNCDHKADGEKRVACRKKCTEFTAWKLSMQAIRQKKKEYKLTPEDKINKMANSINMLSKFIDILQ